MFRLFCLVGLAAASSLQAQEVSSTASGNFAGLDQSGYFYQAELYRAQENLVLRIWESLSADGGYDLALENQAFDYTPMNDDGQSTIGREWIESDADGALVFRVLTDKEGTLYARQVTLSHYDNMIAVTQYQEFSNRLTDRSAEPEEPFSCFSDSCFSCGGDLTTGEGFVGNDATRFEVDYDDLNAALWTPDRARDLGICPAYN